MTIPFICVMIAFFLIYVPRVIVVTALLRQPEGLDNKHPRAQQLRLTGWGARANSAHQNTFESFAPFAAAVVVAHLAHADASRSATCAIVFIAARTLYPIFYLANIDRLRTAVWAVGFLATAAMFLLPLF